MANIDDSVGAVAKVGILDFNPATLTANIGSFKLNDFVDTPSGDDGNTQVHPLNSKLISMNSEDAPNYLNWYQVNSDNTMSPVQPGV